MYTYYVTAAAIASRIASKIAPQGSVIDVQEAHLALALYMLPKGVRRRFITRTPDPGVTPGFAGRRLRRSTLYHVDMLR